MKIIIYPNKSNSICLVIPTGELPFEDVAQKDIPYNIPYRIIDNSELPSDRLFRDAWEYDFTSPDGYGLGPNRYFIEQIESQISELDIIKNKENSEQIEMVIFNLLQERKRFVDEIFKEEGITYL